MHLTKKGKQKKEDSGYKASRAIGTTYRPCPTYKSEAGKYKGRLEIDFLATNWEGVVRYTSNQFNLLHIL